MITYCDVNKCEDCPRYGDDCDGDKRVEHTDLISRADAMGAVQDHFNADGFKGYDDGQKMMDRINALPSADAAQGEWIKHKGEWVDLDFYPTKYECSQCHYCVDEGHDSIFCPNCGARMKGGVE